MPQCADKANEVCRGLVLVPSLTQLDGGQTVTSGDFSRHGGSRFERAGIYLYIDSFRKFGTDAAVEFDQIGCWTKLIK